MCFLWKVESYEEKRPKIVLQIHFVSEWEEQDPDPDHHDKKFSRFVTLGGGRKAVHISSARSMEEG